MNGERKQLIDDIEECLGKFLNIKETKDYLEKVPTTRHEAWLLATSLATLNMLGEIKGLRKDINKLLDNKKR